MRIFSANNRFFLLFFILSSSFLYYFFPLQPLCAEEAIEIKIVAINPSPKAKTTAKIMQALPPEVKQEDVIDAQGLQIIYNPDQDNYAVSGEIELQPREKKTITVKVRNVWSISGDEIQEVRDQLAKNVQSLAGTKYETTSKLLADKVQQELDSVQADEEKAVGIKQKIDLYRAHVKQLEAIRTRVISLESMRRVGDEQQEGARTVEFKVSASNPSNEPKAMTVRSALPEDITSDAVLDKGDFMMLFDQSKGRFIVEKQDNFNAKEAKTYTIILRDIWYIPKPELDYLGEQTQKLVKQFEGSQYAGYATQLGDVIKQNLDKINELQEEIGADASISDRKRTFILNSGRLDLAKKKIKELQELLLELPITVKKKEDQIKAIREFQKALEKILSMGIDPEKKTTWFIILGIIAIVFIVGLIFYFTWLAKLKQSKEKERKIASSQQATQSKT
ncbi:MAG: hypothetical protein A3G33_02800 [Omnitrophica bacterium RIFCSPLOWO2_12_FULL_44_17]|uniref:Uncharacterized protein n=1 Tax=Candidatus Danuiimicrobium aquiferis TaxID=1801832 RepID=A0A1G1KVH8_9BACT|nr:MAG: hypothetical protein A3B72_04280 [Omnitrophica bacterium RIFCSPHIGHO2_02_FULL_45_28]OGW96907.1 MAG: hypothetical protein A3G33_02800 [Omnitrophica bacterium RIFCSPLOWO2_12_FULL_44_17]OGX01814.1 MAG: hypothetical protein A3J12_01645 [Omnitrophica bacterium RIFCSPLOWO2_02_FULL_44_11]